MSDHNSDNHNNAQDREVRPPAPLWTRDFKIITVGTVVSMFGNAMSGFAMSLMVLDLSGSTLLYAVYIAMYTAPQLIMPLFSGAVLDRFSRKKTIYMLDYLSAVLYLLMAAVLAAGLYSFPLFAAYCFVLGSIESIYMVAYDSFYPLLISEGNYQKAYSIASTLETTSAVMVPVSAFLYRQIGLAPLLLVNGICFFVAATMERQIRTEETYIERQKSTELAGATRLEQTFADMREGFRYLRDEKGLLAVTAYFAVLAVTGGVSNVVTLPYFKNTFANGEYIYMMVWGFALAGRAIGGGVHYRKTLPPDRRYLIALIVYIVNALNEGFYLFFPVPVMMLLCFLIGFGGVTSYTIRISATQSYVPDEKKGRFNGAFNMVFMVGALLGELIAGFGSRYLNERTLLMTAMLVSAVSAVLIIGGNRRHVEVVYNRAQ